MFNVIGHEQLTMSADYTLSKKRSSVCIGDTVNYAEQCNYLYIHLSGGNFSVI